MKIYIAGKISGLPIEDAERNFASAAAYLERSGHTPVNPMAKISEQEGYSWEQYMAEDFLIFFPCDAIYMLENWRDSRGARIEHAIAEILGKPIFYEASTLPVGCDFPEPISSQF